MRRVLPLIAVLALAFAPAPFPRPAKEEGGATDKPVNGFYKLDYEKARARAKKDKKAVMVAFYAPWAAPCKALSSKTFSDEKVRRFLESKTVAIEVNIDDKGELQTGLKILGVPCLVFIDGDGKEVGRVLGYRTAESFLTEASKFAK
jgi:thiol:disulfide interchange protein